MKYNSIGEQLIAKAKELDHNYKPDKFNDMSEAIDIILNNSKNSRVFEPTINNISILDNDAIKQILIGFNVSNFEIITYLTTLIENNKQFTETLYLKTPSYDRYQMIINTPLSLASVFPDAVGINHSFNVVQDATSDIKCFVQYTEPLDGNKYILLYFIFSSEEAYTSYKQLASALFTTDTKIKITIKTDE